MLNVCFIPFCPFLPLTLNACAWCVRSCSIAVPASGMWGPHFAEFRIVVGCIAFRMKFKCRQELEMHGSTISSNAWLAVHLLGPD
ncbi:hypothetical protein B0T09DRAFT_325812 [Sordaria sp. MPI-SDFR-AT-0083]|nr:hypothetical protein B0T09DRAFT_325812 [Sordaria sp. MPI-SDFR-AT-0083]